MVAFAPIADFRFSIAASGFLAPSSRVVFCFQRDSARSFIFNDVTALILHFCMKTSFDNPAAMIVILARRTVMVAAAAVSNIQVNPVWRPRAGGNRVLPLDRMGSFQRLPQI